MGVRDLLKNKLRRMIFINRFSGQFLVKKESDSDHVWEMIAMALVLVPEWNKSLTDDKLDLNDIIYRIVIHDLDECLTSDIPRPFKYHSEKLTDAIRDAVDDMMASEFSPELYNDVKNAKDHDVPEGFVVAILDTVQVSLKYLDEIHNCGNNSVKDVTLRYNMEVIEKLILEVTLRTGDLYRVLEAFLKEVLQDIKNEY